MKRLICMAGAMFVAAPMATGTARATDIYPGDYTALPAGTNLALVYGEHIRSNHLDVNGTNVPDSQLRATFTLLRYVRYEAIGDTPVLAEAIVPIGGYHDVKIGGTPQPTSNGLGDAILAVAAYPIHTRDAKFSTLLGFATYVTVPTGAYDPGKISFGGNTYVVDPQLGLIQGLGQGLFLDAAADVAFTVPHTEAGLRYTTAPSFQLQAYLRKAIDASTSLSLGYSGHFGGRQTTGGIDTGLKSNSHQIKGFASRFVTKSLQVQLTAGADVASQGGFRQDFNGQVRFLKLF